VAVVVSVFVVKDKIPTVLPPPSFPLSTVSCGLCCDRRWVIIGGIVMCGSGCECSGNL